jgi:excinuclease ABC subunit B
MFRVKKMKEKSILSMRLAYKVATTAVFFSLLLTHIQSRRVKVVSKYTEVTTLSLSVVSALLDIELLYREERTDLQIHILPCMQMERRIKGRAFRKHSAMVLVFYFLRHSKRVLALHSKIWIPPRWRTASSRTKINSYPGFFERTHFSSISLPDGNDEDNTLFQSEDIPMKQNKFKITAPYAPTGDQPRAIEILVQQVLKGDKYSILRGCTGTGKTLVMAHTISQIGRPTLVLCHNKTLAAQLTRELQSFLKTNHVQLFVSYYNHYVPESYIESTNRYTAKKSSINDELDALRHLATRSLVQYSDVVVVASVSCIYGLGMPKSYLDASLQWSVGDTIGSIDTISDAMTSTLYTSNTGDEPSTMNSSDLSRGQYQLSQASGGGRAILVVWPPSESFPMRINFQQSNGEDYQITSITQGHTSGMTPISSTVIFPAKHHVSDSTEQFEEALCRIQDELKSRVQELRSQSKHIEADRLSQRVSQDIMLLKETGSCPGVENYSRHMALRGAGEAPDTLLDYFRYRNKDDWLLMVDESHVALPQLKAMYGGDQARKKKLVKHGYRLPSALDNRPLRADEFWDRVPKAIFVSATPAKQELALVADIHNNEPVDMIIRPTFVCDPVIHVRKTKNQLEDLLDEIRTRSRRKERTLAMAVSR